MSDSTTQLAFFAAYFISAVCFVLYGMLLTRWSAHHGRQLPRTLVVVRALPVRPVFSLICYTLAGWLALRNVPVDRLAAAVADGISFALMGMILDLLLLVLVKHPFALPARVYYRENWIWVAAQSATVFAALLLAAALG